MSSCKYTHPPNNLIRFALCPHTEASNKDVQKINFAVGPWDEAWFALLEMLLKTVFIVFAYFFQKQRQFRRKIKDRGEKGITEWSCKIFVLIFQSSEIGRSFVFSPSLRWNQSQKSQSPRDLPARRFLKPSASSNATKTVIMVIRFKFFAIYSSRYWIIEVKVNEFLI